jgi:hypothetical protein
MNARPLDSNGSLQQHTYHGLHAEDVAVVTLAAVVLRDVREVREVIGVLARAVDVADLVFADKFLGTATTGLGGDRNTCRPVPGTAAGSLPLREPRALCPKRHRTVTML